MLPNSCNFILFLNRCVRFSSIRKYSPASGAVGNTVACNATAIEIAEAQLSAENKGLEALLLATVVIVVVNVSVDCTIAVTVAVMVSVMYPLWTHAMTAVIAIDNVDVTGILII